MRKQKGYIWYDRRRKCWFGRWYQDELRDDGTVKRVQRSEKLADHDNDRYRTESDVRPLLDEKLRPLNEGKMDARSTMTLAQFVERHYQPEYVNIELKSSTRNGYSKLWDMLQVADHISVQFPCVASPPTTFTTCLRKSVIRDGGDVRYITSRPY